MAICSDITRIKEIEQQSYKMRSMFFSSVAHELRTPLNSIIPILRMVLSNPNLSPELRQYIQIVLNSALHLQNVIEDALDMSRIENNKFAVHKEMFDLNLAINEVVEIMNFQL